jgi:mono/diheme cytochrome c family protein
MISPQLKGPLLGSVAAVAVLAAAFGASALLQPTTGAPATPTTALIANPVSAPPTSPDEAAGRHIFSVNCAHCHGDDATGDECPNLHGLRKSNERIARLVTEGIKGEMPSFRKKLDDAQVGQLIAYLRTLREG